MKTFKQLISENTTAPAEVQASKTLGHLDHIEDNVFLHGKAGSNHALNTLREMHNYLSGQKSKVKVGEKFDGAPSLVFGRHPQTGRFFVATKSAHNKNPKINYTEEDIINNHGHAPGLVEKLKAALEHLPKVMPPKGVYQGDVMYTKPDIRDDGKNYSFTPNTLTYSTDKKSEEGKKIAKSQIGVAVHTSYEDDGSRTLEGHSARFMPDLNKFSKHPDVHIISTEMKPNPEGYTDQQKAEFEKHMAMAKSVHESMGDATHSAIQPHSDVISTYINTEVRRNGVPNHKDFMDYVDERGQKEISKLKSQSAIDRKTQMHKAKLAEIKKNKAHFDKMFELHKHLQNSKNTLVSASENNASYSHSIDGVPSKPEGSVVVNPVTNTIGKVVNRAEFSAANFAKAKFAKQQPPEQ